LSTRTGRPFPELADELSLSDGVAEEASVEGLSLVFPESLDSGPLDEPLGSPEEPEPPFAPFEGAAPLLGGAAFDEASVPGSSEEFAKVAIAHPAVGARMMMATSASHHLKFDSLRL
jgi:hypothetical protein